jgi:hypothetical protein
VKSIRLPQRLARCVLGAVALLGCQAGPLLEVPPAPWGGPDAYELPRFRWSPGQVVVMRGTCTHEQGASDSVFRQAAVGRDASGLVEVVSETDGLEVGRSYVDGAGRVVRVVVPDHVKQVVGDDPMARFGAFGDWAFQPLERNRPVAFQLPIARLLGPGVAGRMPGLDRGLVDGRIEYLGQTAFAGARAAGYRMWLGATVRPVGGTVDLRGEGLSYSDASSGLALHYRMVLRVTMRAPGHDRQTFQMDCQSTVDRAASAGV